VNQAAIGLWYNSSRKVKHTPYILGAEDRLAARKCSSIGLAALWSCHAAEQLVGASAKTDALAGADIDFRTSISTARSA
jgi:hypothetical protein